VWCPASTPNAGTSGVADLAPDGSIPKLLEKLDDPPSDIALVGVYLFTLASWTRPRDRTLRPWRAGNRGCHPASRRRGTRRPRVDHRGLVTRHREEGRVARGQPHRARQHHAPVGGNVDDESTVTGEVLIEPGPRLTVSVRGPAVIGANVHLIDSSLGPFTSIGANYVVERSDAAESHRQPTNGSSSSRIRLATTSATRLTPARSAISAGLRP
jgi:glucose-1-phosphate thymidylyltransferase